MAEGVTAVILAGVHDWGACVLGRAVTRPLAPVGNRPMIDHVLASLARAGIASGVICANGHTRQLQAALGERRASGFRLRYYEDRMPRGPAGCVLDSSSLVDADDYVVVEATAIPHFDLAQLIQSHRLSGAAATVGIRTCRERTSNTERVDSPAGVYVFTRKALSHFSRSGFQDLKEGALPKLHRAGLRVDVHAIDEPGGLLRLHGVASYFAVNEWAIRQASLAESDEAGYERLGQALIHKEANIHPTAEILGPVIVGPGCSVRRRAIVVGPTSLDRHSCVEAEAVVSRSALWAGAIVGRGAHTDRCILAHGAQVPDDSRFFNAVFVSGNRTTGAIAESYRCAAGSGEQERSKKVLERVSFGG